MMNIKMILKVPNISSNVIVIYYHLYYTIKILFIILTCNHNSCSNTECILTHCSAEYSSGQSESQVSLMIMLCGMLQLYLNYAYINNIHIFMIVK